MDHNTTNNKEFELLFSRQMAGIGVDCMSKARELRILIIGQKSVCFYCYSFYKSTNRSVLKQRETYAYLVLDI